MTRPAGVVVVCGLPHSGNKLVRGLLLHHGFEPRQVEVRHFGENWDEMHPRIAEYGGRLRAIAMLRDPACNREGQRLAGHPRYTTAEKDCLEHWPPTLLAAAGCALMPVRYEAVIEDPETWGRSIAEFAGADAWRGWHVEVYDGNAKHREALRLVGTATGSNR